MIEILHPPDWPRPRGFSNDVAAHGTLVFIAGQVGWDQQCRVPSEDFADQVRQALTNVLTVLALRGGKPEHIVRMTWYVTDKREYLASYKAIGEIYRGMLGRHYPAMTAVEVAGLVEDGAKVEIEATAVLPD